MSIIDRFVKISLENKENAEIKATKERKYVVLRYPCAKTSSCVPYELELHPGIYKIECWGSRGQEWQTSRPGKGAYTSGLILIHTKTTMFAYIGAVGFFNSMRNKTYGVGGCIGGGATDLRLKKGDNWYDIDSLKSRIMVAAGGGGAEWAESIGGNGGKLVGGSSVSAKTANGSQQYEEECKGANQTSGSQCPSYSYYSVVSGEFGSAGFVEESSGLGGLGGGGYYGGSSYLYAFAGSGGSSFISGYEGCDAVKDTSTIEHTGSPFHYSRYIFTKTEMIEGNQTMPLPTGGKDIFDDKNGGAFRITIVSFINITRRGSLKSMLTQLVFVIIIIC